MLAEHDRAVDVARVALHMAEALGLEAARSRNLNTIGCGKVMMGDRSGLDDLSARSRSEPPPTPMRN